MNIKCKRVLQLLLMVAVFSSFRGMEMVHAAEDVPSAPETFEVFLPIMSMHVDGPGFVPEVNPDEIFVRKGDSSGDRPDCYRTGNLFPYGQCTWWAAEARRDVRGTVSGDARYWVNYIPSVFRNKMPESGDLAVFQPWVAGALSRGHVAYVSYAMPYDWYGRRWFYILEANGPQWAPVRFYHNGVPIRGRWVYHQNGINYLPRLGCG